jgi:NADH kinase
MLLRRTVLSLRAFTTSSARTTGINSNILSTPPNSGTPTFALHPVSNLAERHLPNYESPPNSIISQIKWTSPPRNILVVKRPWHDKVLDATITFIKHVHSTYPSTNIILTSEVAEEVLTNNTTKPNDNTKSIPIYTGPISEIISRTDLLVTLGGDGTILRGVSLFSNTTVPPVLSFSLGTLGFLLPFDFQNHSNAFKSVYDSNAYMLKRERIECHIVKAENSTQDVSQAQINQQPPTEEEMERLKRLSAAMNAPFDEILVSEELQSSSHNLKIHAMNDIVLHRGSLPGLINLDVYINGHFLTRTTADGLIFATPTGSTAYSLSAGGSIIHPVVQCILLTPICPRSLSFRPLVLPLNSHILIKVIGKENTKVDYTKTNAKLSIDGIPQMRLSPGDEIHVISESFSRINHLTASSKNVQSGLDGVHCVVQSRGDWVNGINGMLGFNLGFKSAKDQQKDA